MKIIVEERDIQEVQRVSNDWYGILITNDQAKTLIENNKILATELYLGLDTLGREHLADAVIDWVMKDMPKPKTKNSAGGTSWEWPRFGSGKSYQSEFEAVFQEAAGKIGLALVEGWRKDGSAV